jgi:3-phenylpropionate/cinnamic acid dioxygenase small subunit
MTIDELLADAKIRDVQMRYCRAVDRMDFDLLATCFHSDATVDFGFFVGGVDGFIAQAREGLKTYTSTTHFTGNQLVEVHGESAWAEHYALATHRCPLDETGPVRDFVTAVRYVDRLERRDGAWRIAKRTCILDWWRNDPVSDTGPGPQVQPGRRDRSDPSYGPR